MWLAGVDGCKAGWVVAARRAGAVTCRVAPTLATALPVDPAPQWVALDIPLGLPAHGQRACDVAARAMLGPARGRSVFAAPARYLLGARTYAEACAWGASAEGRKISRQTWNLFPKIREADAWLRANPALAGRVREAHPELAFAGLAGRPLTHSKKTPAGQAERQRVLEAVFGLAVRQALAERRPGQCAADDVLDALALLWLAERLAVGQARTLPAQPPLDACGVPMAITIV